MQTDVQSMNNSMNWF